MPVVAVSEVSRFTEECMVRCGAPPAAARQHTALLVHADSVGHHSHGLNRLGLYLNDIKSGACNPAAQPVILKEEAATAWVDGRDALGATVGHFCMNLAIKKAKEVGVGWVCAKGSNHYGMAGYWALQAEKEGLIGMAFTNTSPIMVPTRAKQRALGTNPIGMAAPAEDGDSMLVDMAMTTVAMGKVEIQLKKQEPLPEGWALGPDGKVTTDAQLAFDTGCLLPLGGSESTSGYKGYGLCAMVEVFCSALSAEVGVGTPPTHQGRPWTTAERQEPPNLAQCFVAVNPEFFAPGFRGRVTECLQHWRNLEPVDPALPVLAPGDKERNNAARTHVTGAVAYAQAQIDELQAIAHALQVMPIIVL